MRRIRVSEVEHLAYDLARKHMSWDEPIPDFSTRYPGILESCLSTVFQTFDGKDLYTSLADKSSILFYFMIKNHPFLNGNKRIAVTTLLIFLYLNNKWLDVSDEALYQMALDVAESKPQFKESVVKYIKRFLLDGIVSGN